jgi:hypothetical protein
MEKLDIDIEAKHGEANPIENWQDDTISFGNEYLPNLTTLAILRDMLKLVKTSHVLSTKVCWRLWGSQKNLISWWKCQRMMFL